MKKDWHKIQNHYPSEKKLKILLLWQIIHDLDKYCCWKYMPRALGVKKNLCLCIQNLEFGWRFPISEWLFRFWKDLTESQLFRIGIVAHSGTTSSCSANVYHSVEVVGRFTMRIFW